MPLKVGYPNKSSYSIFLFLFFTAMRVLMKKGGQRQQQATHKGRMGRLQESIMGDPIDTPTYG